MRQLESVADMWAAPSGAKRGKASAPTKTRAPVGGQINYTTERTLRLADLPQPNASADPQHPFFGHTFCFTGELQSFSRLDAMAAVADCGAINRQGVTKKTTYVVLGRSDCTHSASAGDLGASGKERKALDYIALGQQITVLGERQFVQLLGRAKVNREVLPSVPVVSPVRPDSRPNAKAGTSDRPAAASIPPMSSPDGAGVRLIQNRLDKPVDGPQWLIKLKRAFGLN
ncbi:MAG: BRCT domain-containing protein [Arthrobacter sp.]|nr:BRCT domain-containing protein [Arthrobacter sp.]MDZ4353674.1 BRCT domain-containing protein [Arthrobacter sp.]